MTIKLSDDFEHRFYKAFNKERLITERIYDYIDALEKGRLIDYNSFKSLLHKYPVFLKNYDLNYLNYFSSFINDIWVDTKNGRSIGYQEALKEEITDQMVFLFKNKYNSDFISVPDKSIILEYAGCLSGASWNSNNIENLYSKLEKKLGDSFKEWSVDWNRENILKLFHQMIVDLIVQQDSHRYNDDTLKCFFEAEKKDDFVEELSLCQYKMHGVNLDMVGDIS